MSISGFSKAQLICSLLLIFFVGMDNILTEWKAADIIQLARLIEISGTINPNLFEKVAPGKAMAGIELNCNDTVSRSVTTLKLVAFIIGSRSSDELTAIRSPTVAMRAIQQRIWCVPTDGNAWLLKAKFDHELQTTIEDLRLSYKLAPAERWVMEPRIEFVSNLAIDKNFALLQEFTLDIQRLTNNLPFTELAQQYANSSLQTREIMMTELYKQPYFRRKQIYHALIQLGIKISNLVECNIGDNAAAIIKVDPFIDGIRQFYDHPQTRECD